MAKVSSPALCPREKKLALEAVIGVLGVFTTARFPGGVPGFSPTSDFVLSDLILADVGVLNGSRFRGGKRRFWTFFLPALACGLDLGSVSATGGGTGILEDELGARGVSSAFIASARLETPGLAEIGASKGGRLEDLAEKKG
jgi:hypothetical protein